MRCRLNTLEIDVHTAAALRELDRIRQQVPDYLAQTIRIALDQTFLRLKTRLQSDAFDVSRGPQRIERSVDDRREIERVQIEPEITSDDSRHVKQIVDESRLGARIALDRFDCAGRVCAFDFAVADH